MRKPLALAVLFITTLAGAQTSERVTVSVVEVPVTVVGKGGAPVRGLTAENFQVFDDGKKREITGFDAIDFAQKKSELTAITPLPPAARRNFLLLFDLSFSTPTSVTRAQQAAREFLAKMVGRPDRVAVATIDVQRGFRLVTGFTTDHKLIADALDDPSGFIGYDPLQLASNFVTKDLPSARLLDRDTNLFRLMSERAEENWNKEKAERQIDMLGAVARSLRTVNGRKYVVFLSDGFDAHFLQGTDDLTREERENREAARERGEVWKFDPDKTYGHTSVGGFLRQMTQRFRRSDVVLHAIDTRGVRTHVDAREGFVKETNDSLHVLASATGGTVFQNTNDLTANFDRLLRREEVVYVLAFRAPASEAGKYHELSVKVSGVEGARVTHRPGYHETGDETGVERTLSVAEILINDIPQTDLRVAATAMPFPATAEVSQVPVIVEVSGTDIVAAALAGEATADIFVYAFAEDGVVRDSLAQRLEIDLAKAGPRLLAGGLRYYGTLALPPGRYAVRSFVRVNETRKTGFVRTDLLVPAASELVVSQPLFFDVERPGIVVRGKSHAPDGAPNPFEIGGEAFAPTLRPPHGARRFAIFVANAAAEQLTFAVAPAAKVVSTESVPGMVRLLFEIEPVEPQPQWLTVTVRTNGSDRSRTASASLVAGQ